MWSRFIEDWEATRSNAGGSQTNTTEANGSSEK